jgi:hypothetical protein
MDYLELTNRFDDEVMQSFALLLERRLAAGERLEDALWGAVSLGAERARRLEREACPIDAEFAFSMWCWWPLKRRVSREFSSSVEDFRPYAFEGVADGESSRLAATVRGEALTLDFATLYQLQAERDLWALFHPPEV